MERIKTVLGVVSDLTLVEVGLPAGFAGDSGGAKAVAIAAAVLVGARGVGKGVAEGVLLGASIPLDFVMLDQERACAGGAVS